jgi:four helix bundle protein
MLNIAEWAGKYSKADKKNYYITARWSVFECVAILRILKIEKTISEELFQKLYTNLEEISKMLSGLINALVK